MLNEKGAVLACSSSVSSLAKPGTAVVVVERELVLVGAGLELVGAAVGTSFTSLVVCNVLVNS